MAKRPVISGVLILASLCVLAALIILPGPTKSVEQPENGRTTDVRILEVEPSVLKDWIELPASVEPSLSTAVPAEVDGRIDWIGPKEGELIAKSGTPILRIDERSFRAQMEEAKAAYELSSRNCKRFEELHAEGVLSDEQLDQCRTKESSDAAKLEIATIELEKATVRAPITGVLNKSYFDVGEYVRRGDRVADIVVIDPVKILVKVPERDISYVHKGEHVRTSFAFLKGKSYEGTVNYLSVVGDLATRTYEVEIIVPNHNLEILPSMIATVRILRHEIPDAITVPLFSVIPSGDSKVIFVEKDGKAEERHVELGILDGSRIQVVKGLEPHERLIVDGHRELVDGEAVRVLGLAEVSP